MSDLQGHRWDPPEGTRNCRRCGAWTRVEGKCAKIGFCSSWKCEKCVCCGDYLLQFFLFCFVFKAKKKSGGFGSEVMTRGHAWPKSLFGRNFFLHWQFGFVWEVSRTLHITGKRWGPSPLLAWLLSLLAAVFPKAGCVRFERSSRTAAGSVLQILYFPAWFPTANSLRLAMVPPKSCNSREVWFQSTALDFVPTKRIQTAAAVEVLHCHSAGKIKQMKTWKQKRSKEKNIAPQAMIEKDLHPTKKR